MSIVSVRNDTLGKVSVINAFAPLAPVITSYNILISGVIADDAAVDTAGGQTIRVNGTGFISGAVISLGGSGVTTAYINANTLTFTAPAKTAATYAIYVLNPDGGTAIFIPGVVYSGTPAWTTTAISPATVYETNNITTTALVTTGGDAPIVYSLASGALPAGAVLNASTGVITGTAPAVGSNTTYTFTIKATDQQLQDSTSTSFSLTINTDVVTWSSPAAASTVTLPQNAASTTALVASSAAGKAITYTSTALPAGLSISGATVTGTPTVIASTATTFTATAATSGRTTTAVINWTISVAADPNFRNTTLLLSGAAATETFIADASTNNFPITIAANTKPNNFNPYTPGYYSNYFDGNADYLTAPSNAAFQLGTDSYTFEAWIYPTALGVTNTNNIINIGTYTTGLMIRVYSATTGFEIYTNNTQRLATSTGLTANSWQHIALVRNVSACTLYINGQINGTFTDTSSISPATATLIIGMAAHNSGEFFTGYMSNYRLVKGVAVYTGTFTPSTTPLTAITNTSLLTCQSNQFIDNSANAFAITKSGDTKVNSFTPFVPNTQYATQGSTNFNGTTDYLLAPSSSQFNLPGDFTIECWIYKNNPAADGNGIFGIGTTDPDSNLVRISTGKLQFWLGGSNSGASGTGTKTGIITCSTSILSYLWYHVALVRSGSAANNVKLYLNGVLDGQGTGTYQIPTNYFVVGRDYPTSSAEYFPGYISNVRVVKGVAVYTGTFTPPAAPLSITQSAGTNIAAITGSATSLLTCQTNQPASNSMFLDSSTNAFPVTRAGNTSAGTFTPYGGANWSNYFGMKTDYISIPATAPIKTFTGDFTFECWINPTDTGISTNWGIWDSRQSGSTANSMIFTLQNLASPVTGQWRLGYYNGAQNFGTGTVLANQWTHVAFVRSGSTLTYYVNGVAGGTTAVGAGTISGNATTNPIYIGSKDNTIGGYGTVGYISNFRIVNGTAVYTGNFAVPTAPLTAIANTALLTCQSNRSVDNSANAFVVTLGSATVSAQRFSPFAPQTQTAITNSAYFDGTGDYLTAPSNAAFEFGTGDFTIEAWIYRTDTGVQRGIVDNTHSAGGRTFFFLTTNGLLNLFDGTSVWLSSAITVPVNQWVHVAAVRISATTKLYINGAQQASSSDARTYGAAVTYIGRQFGTAVNDFMGYISNVRMVKGVGVYTGNFTVPTAPLTATQSAGGTNIVAVTGSQTSLLTCQSPTFVDNSTNAFAITAFGEAKPRTVNPFGFTNASAAYSAATYVGSAYFDGSTDCLTAPNNTLLGMGSGAFTVEFWMYQTSLSTNRQILDVADGNSAGRLILWVDGGGQLINLGASGTPRHSTASGAIVVNTWIHVALVRSAGVTKFYINGTQSGSNYTDSNNYTCTTGYVHIGINSDGSSYPYAGYLSNWRMVKGVAVYTSNFVPPSAPLSAITNTSLLLNMTSAGIYDSASGNNLETVADAKRVVTHTPYAGSFYSNYFDGTGDYLSVPANAALVFGTGDFTVELWLYIPGGITTPLAIIGNGTGGIDNAYWSLEGVTGGNIAFFAPNSATQYFATTTQPWTSGWAHIAVSRAGANTKLFLNGVQQGSTYTTNNSFVSGGNLYIGASSYTPGSRMMPAGYISNVRIVKGVAVYTGNFAVPTAPLTATQAGNGATISAISGTATSLLTCQSNRFVDNSTNLFAITRFGHVAVQSFNPFQRNSAATMYFDGNGDYLKVPTNPGFFFGTGDFTIECWAYFNSTATQSIIADINGTTGSAVWGMFYNSAAGLRLVVGAAGTTNSFAWTLSTSTWYHIAITRSGSSLRAYINGVQLGATQSNTSNINVANSTSSGNFYVGNFNTLDTPLNAYITDLRITNGVARYTGATLVLPTTAFMAL